MDVCSVFTCPKLIFGTQHTMIPIVSTPEKGHLIFENLRVSPAAPLKKAFYILSKVPLLGRCWLNFAIGAGRRRCEAADEAGAPRLLSCDYHLGRGGVDVGCWSDRASSAFMISRSSLHQGITCTWLVSVQQGSLIWQRLKNIRLVTGLGGSLRKESEGLATNPPCEKPIADYSTLHGGPRQEFVTEGPQQRYVRERGGGDCDKPLFRVTAIWGPQIIEALSF